MTGKISQLAGLLIAGVLLLAEFLSDAKRLQLEIDPLTGAGIEALLKNAYAAHPATVAEAAKLVP